MFRGVLGDAKSAAGVAAGLLGGEWLYNRAGGLITLPPTRLTAFLPAIAVFLGGHFVAKQAGVIGKAGRGMQATALLHAAAPLLGSFDRDFGG